MTRAWLVRAGRHGERETLALEQGLAVVGWPELQDLSGHATRASLMDALRQAFPDDGTKQLLNWQAQLWAFLHTISEGDLAVLPLKTSPAVAIGQVTGSYTYRPDLPPDARHTRPVKWLLGAFLTVCEVKCHDAARRLDSLVQAGRDPGWAGPGALLAGAVRETDATPSDEETSSVDIERYAADQISARIAERFAGHGLARLVEAIFAARGMTTWRSPEGPDGGVDVLVGSGPLGIPPASASRSSLPARQSRSASCANFKVSSVG